MIQPIDEGDLEDIEWRRFGRERFAKASEGADDSLYDYLDKYVS